MTVLASRGLEQVLQELTEKAPFRARVTVPRAGPSTASRLRMASGVESGQPCR